MKTPFHLQLFIAGTTPKSAQAILDVHALCEEALGGNCLMEVVDILQHPERLETGRIVMTPTLVKLAPPPARRVVGNFSDRERVLEGLEIDAGIEPGAVQERRRHAG